ncbi:serine protease [Bacillus sp. HMF5848]|uniref:S1C family serine protease n=1 Tax=Bacillus sp. HMF5848 TaxID=2495421 RepID=UPI000F7800EA|nr:S1C family serine protease [Bacillus sp. HMF5848]RSK29166.1 serine protease [Bacillus sp. HMF5848]
MGYYDQDYEHLRRPRKGNKASWFITALVGAVLGAMFIIFSIPTLSKFGVLPYDVVPAGQGQLIEQNDIIPNEGGTVQQVSVNVVSQVTQAVDKVSNAVVGVVNLQQARGFWDTEVMEQEAGTGSGVIYKKENGRAFIVTNHHVIEDATNIEVSLADGTRVPATILGSDIWTDLAVLEIDAEHVDTVAEFGNSDTLRAGEPVIAIGNPLGLQFSGSVTQGIISGTNRTIPIDLDQDGSPDWHAEVLQTDAAINPGNSGGALVNIAGELIGINSMKIAQSAVEGIGLAIPINYAIPIINDLEQFNEVRRPYMGVSLVSLNEIPAYHIENTFFLPKEVTEGVAIREVVPLSPADRAGLKMYDVIVEMDGEPIGDVIELRKHLYNKKSIGDSMEVTVYRDGQKVTVTMQLQREAF